MGRLAPGARTNIHPSSGLQRHILFEEDHEILHGPMRLAAACRSWYESGRYFIPGPICGCGRCNR